MKKHKHGWTTAVNDEGLLRLFANPRTLRIIEHWENWVLGRYTLTPANRFGAWEIVDSRETLAEILDLADEFPAKEHNPYGICNDYWHMESHSCHSICGSCRRRHFDQELKDSYKVPFHKGPRVQEPMSTDGGPRERNLG